MSFRMWFSLILISASPLIPLRAQILESGDTTASLRSTTADSASAQSKTSEGIVRVGAVLGAPSGIALVAGLDLGPVTARLSGGSWGKNWNGVQADLAYNFIQGPSLGVGLGVVAGEFQNLASTDQSGNHYTNQRYEGLALDVSLAGFLLQTGLASGPAGYKNPQFTFQFGYWWTL